MSEKPSLADLENRIRRLEKENQHYKGLLLNTNSPQNLSSPEGNQAKQLYRMLFEQSNDAILIHDLDGRILDANSRASEMLGYTREQLLQKTIPDIHAEGESEAMENAFQKTVAVGNTQFESKFKRADGGIIDVEISSRIADKNRGLVQGIIRDITKRKWREDELRKRETLFEKIFDILPIGLWLADENGQLLRGNPAGVRIWGAEPRVDQEEYGVFKARRLPSREELAPDDWALVHTINEGITVVDEMLEIDAFDGEKRIVLNYTAPLLDELAQVEGAIIVNQDITERVRAVESLEESEENFRALAENANDGIIIASKDGRHIFANKASSNILGYTLSELLKTKVTDLIHPDEIELVIRRFKKRLMGKPVPTNYETIMVRKDGKNVVLNMTASQISWNREPAVLVFFRDISELKLAEKEKIRLENRLRQSHKMEAIGTLAGGIAHDFNNILGIILGNAELAMDDVPEWNPAIGFLKEICSATLRAKDVVRQLLAFSRKSEEQKKPIDLPPLVKETMKMLRATIPTSISFELDTGKAVKTVHADVTQISQVLLNLVSNAADAMANEGGFLRIALENDILSQNDEIFDAELAPGNFVKIKVSDSGPGIPSENLDRIFDPYFTTKEIGKGTGMGLAVVHGIVKGHRGGIRVTSDEGKGAVFEVFLPAVQDGAPESKERAKGILPKGKETILFVDDEEAMVKLNQQRLERLGYKVFASADPLKALDLFRNTPRQFDLIITDMTMPRMSGDRLAREILKIQPDTPIILCTGYSDRISEESAEELGIRKYVEKPIELEALAQSVRDVLNHK